MNTDYRIESNESLQGITNEELLHILPELDVEQRLQLAKRLRVHNENLKSRIVGNNQSIDTEKAIIHILLRRAWRGLDADSKKENAHFFKALNDQVESDYE